MDWNHRIIRFKHEGIEDMLLVAEVFYNEDGTPCGYTEPFMMSETIEGLTELLNQMHLARLQPILNEWDFVDKRPKDDEDEDDNPVTRLIKDAGGDLDRCPLCGNAETCTECRG